MCPILCQKNSLIPKRGSLKTVTTFKNQPFKRWEKKQKTKKHRNGSQFTRISKKQSNQQFFESEDPQTWVGVSDQQPAHTDKKQKQNNTIQNPKQVPPGEFTILRKMNTQQNKIILHQYTILVILMMVRGYLDVICIDNFDKDHGQQTIKQKM